MSRKHLQADRMSLPHREIGRTTLISPMRLLPLLSLILLLFVLAAPDSAQAADQLRVHSANGDWAVTSGTADDDIGKVIARGAPKAHIRYAIEGADGFSIGRRSGRVSYDGTAIATEQVSLTVTARDARGQAASVTHVLTVAVTQPTQEPEPLPPPANGDNQNQEPPADQPGTVTFAPAAPLVGKKITASLSDPDGPPEGATALSPTWQWAASSARTGTFTDITGATSASFTPGVEHDSLYLRATASYADGQGTGKTAYGITTVRVNVEPPRFTKKTPETKEVAENTTQVTVLRAKGASTSFNYAVDGGADAAKFQVVSAVESNTLVSRLVFKEAPDYESPTDVLSTTPANAAENNEYVVTVRASYRGGLGDVNSRSVTRTIIVTVTDVDEPTGPAFPKRSYTFSVPENKPMSFAVLVQGHNEYNFRYRLSGKDAGYFYLYPYDGEFRSHCGLRTDGTYYCVGPDFETKDTYELKVSAYWRSPGQEDRLLDKVPVTLNITDADDPGTLSVDPSGRLEYDQFWPLTGVRINTATRVTATLREQDTVTAGSVSWQWHSSPAPSTLGAQLGPWTALSGNGADTATYTVQHADAGKYLRVTATYDDNHGNGKTVRVATGRVMLDVVHPYVYIDMHIPAGSYGVNAPFDVTVRFSEPVTGFTESDLKVTNGTVSNFTEQGSGKSYRATITPVEERVFYIPETEEEYKRILKMPSEERLAFLDSKRTGGVVVSVPKGAVTDMHGNKNENRPSKGTYYDVTPPTVSFDLNPGRRIGRGTYYVSLDPSERLHDDTVSVEDLKVVNGTISDFNGSRFIGNAYEFYLTPTAGLAHGTPVTVTLPKGAVADEAGNKTTKATVYSAQIDLEGPTAELTVPSAKSGVIKVNIQFDEPVIRVQGKPMLSVTGGTLQFLQRQEPFVKHKRWTTVQMRGLESGEEWESLFTYHVTYASSYIATIAVSPGYGTADKPVVIVVPRGSFKDQAGNRNSEPIGPLRVTRSGETVTQETPDAPAPPTVTLEGPDPVSGRKLHNQPFEVTVTFSEDVVGFDAATEVEVTGGTVTAFRKTSGQTEPDVYVLTIQPDGPGALRVVAPAKAARSKETRRYNEESNRLRYNITDAPLGPTVIIHDNPDLTNPQGTQERSSDAFEVLVTFSENVVGFDGVNEIQVSGGTITAAHKVSGQGEPSQFIITVEPDGPGTLEFKVPAQAARSKETRRYNEESNTLTYTIVTGG